MSQITGFIMGAVFAAVVALAVFVPVVEFYKVQYKAAIEFIRKIKIEFEKFEKENEE